MLKWYVVQANPQQEFKAEENLRRQDYETWLPHFKKLRRHARRTDETLAALFPGYLFVRMDVEAMRWRSINGTYGVKNLLCQDSRPLPVADCFIDDLRRSSIDGTLFEAPEQFRPGDTVRITGGAFSEHTGTLARLSGKDRIMVLLSILGREVEAMLPRSQIAAAA